MKQLILKIFCGFVGAIFITNFCYANELSDLINKSDFRRFKQAYENSNLSEDKKIELLNQVNTFIEESLNKLKPYWHGKIPPLKNINKIKQVRYLFNFISTFFVACNAFSIYSLYRVLKRKNRYMNRTAAQIGSVDRNIIYSNTKDWQIRNFNTLLLERVAQVIFVGLISLLWAYAIKCYNLSSVYYKQYKKALKIKKLIEESISKDCEIEKLYTD